MIALLEVVLTLFIILGLASWRANRWIWPVVLAGWFIFLGIWGQISFWLLSVFWLLWIPAVAFVHAIAWRRRIISAPILKLFKTLLPPMSQTEREALDAGDVWWEGELFSGQPNWNKLHEFAAPELSEAEQAFLDNQTNTLCSKLDDWKIVHELHDLPEEVWNYIKQEKFWGLEISEAEGGLGFSPLLHSAVICKVASRSVSTAVTLMVPNSLGPAELLHFYGTDEQKKYYLPRLASGEEIPCFALTSPHAGSDAAAIPDRAIVCMGEYEGEQVLGMSVTWEKHYITLAPVATLLGLAVKLYDPEHLLGEQEDIGITLCLIPTDHPGVEIGRRHLPLNSAFMNGPTSGKDVFIPLGWIIGGKEMAGQGWRMLMECLSIGRSISLPSMSAANAMLCYRMTSIYARLRKQFRVSIGKFEGVEEALSRIAGYTYMMEASRVFTAQAVKDGVKPAVPSAIAKYHMTEMGRQVINDAMDIHGGRGIQMGPMNYLAQMYISAPIAITVEGANILTRNLIIFGQGAMRAHPYARAEIAAAQQEDPDVSLKEFDKVFWKHVGHILGSFAHAFVLGLTGSILVGAPHTKKVSRYYRHLTRMSAAFAFSTDITLLIVGGDIKRKERLSARLGDILSHLYLGSAVLKYYRDNGESAEDLPYVEWALQTNLAAIQTAFGGFWSNFPNRLLGKLCHWFIFP